MWKCSYCGDGNGNVAEHDCAAMRIARERRHALLQAAATLAAGWMCDGTTNGYDTSRTVEEAIEMLAEIESRESAQKLREE